MRELYSMKAVLATGLIVAAGALLAAGLMLPAVLGDDAPLEPSIQNEVDHAVCLGEKWVAGFAKTNQAEFARLAATNLVSATNCVSATNAVWAAALGHLPADLFATNSLEREQVALRLVSLQRGGGFWADPRGEAATNRVHELLATLLALSILSSL